MKLKLLITSLLLLGCWQLSFGQVRYLDEIFVDVTVDSDVVYGSNFSILPIIGGQSTVPLDLPLLMDIYRPVGDTMSERPVVILTHAGDFLPPVLNTIPYGTKKDSSIVAFCKAFAKRGFVAVAMEHRQGWNPLSTIDIERTQGILEASVKATQDMHTAVRFLRKTYSEDGNPWGIDSARIAAGGEDAAGFASTNLIFLGDLAEAALPKFLDFAVVDTPRLIIDTLLWGDIKANNARPFCVANHVGYSSKISMGFSLQGGLGDFSWIDSMEAPYVGVQNIADWNSLGIRDVTPGASGDILFSDGAWADTIAFQSNFVGNNDVFDVPMNNPIVDLALQRSGGVHGMLVLNTPRDTGQVICDSTAGVDPDSYGNNNDPWAWYDEAWYTAAWGAIQGTSGSVAVCRQNLGNPNDPALSALYIDTVATYLSYHMVLAMNIWGTPISSIDDIRAEVKLKIYPNPAQDFLQIEAEKPIKSVILIDMQGRVVQRHENLRNLEFTINRGDMPPGIYGLRLQFEEGTITDKVVWN